jgi:hypothetical protein
LGQIESSSTGDSDRVAVRRDEHDLLEGIECGPVVPGALGFPEQPADKPTNARDEDADVFLVLAATLVKGLEVVKFG